MGRPPPLWLCTSSGLVLLGAGGQADLNLIGSRLFVPVDLDVLTDRCAKPVRRSEFDVIGWRP